ncbi:N-formylglutamate amidohydrolase [Salinarimonas ramus]|uniref:N-formylglutamate amidohydrolase n=1 Tax=Salinarimonas ramus TaxID=690164 RepID=A0A917V7N4_9HYPH|nr:N-formylglutamate amidohydrolase [Salinarimonas ramus]GGK46818.1 N-formylglutamate amidohydrolase [Salinarimonas ramus]
MDENLFADPPPVTVENEGGTSPVLLVCEHASRFIPVRYQGLGLAEPDLSRHIAWDIGAAELARALSRRLDATLVLCGYSRLLVDCNRPLSSPTLMPAMSETTPVPGNAAIDAAERERRIAGIFRPFQDTVAAQLDAHAARGVRSTVVGVHSFTPVFKGVARPWHAGVLYGRAAAFGERLVAALGGPSETIAANEPYVVDAEDYTVPVHGDARGLDAVLLEIRNDLLGEDARIAAWADRLADALARSLG